VQGLLDARYLEDWTFNKTLSGVPQGSVVSPILSNLLLNKLDTFVETTLIPHYTRRSQRKRRNLEYMRLISRAACLTKKGHIKQAQKLRQQARKLPSIDPNDPEYRRLNYCRYADDVRHLTRCLIPLAERRSSEETTSGLLNLSGGES
jgi:retron-type reverse transcriptase